MTSDPGTRQRSSRTPRRVRARIRWLGWWSVLTLSVLAVWFGGVPLESRAVAHGMLAVGLLAAATLPAAVLASAGVARQVAGGLGALLLAVLVGLVPLPAALLRAVAPGVAEAHGPRWWTLSLRPEATVGEVAYLALLLGAGVLVAVWGAARWRRWEAERSVLLLTAALVAFAGAHHYTGTSALFGTWPSALAPGGFFAPFVDANHFGAAVVLGVPVAIGVASRERRWSGWWALALATVTGALVLLLASGSRGAAGGLAVAIVAVSARSSGARMPVRAIGSVVGAAALVVAIGTARSGEGLSIGGRLATWGWSIGALPDAWLAGTGGGTIDAIIALRRQSPSTEAWAHLHNDPLEWLVETGLVGLVALAAAILLLRPRSSADPERARWFTAGLVATLIAATVEFPLQMPAIGVGFVALLACRRAVFEERRPASPTAVRALLVGTALLQVAGGLWTAGAAVADDAARDAAAWREDREAARRAVERLRLVAPWRPEIDLVAGWEALARGDADAAAAHGRRIRDAHRADPHALRRAAAVAWRAGATDEAFAALALAEARAPTDWRTAVVRARMEPGDGDVVGAWTRAFAQGAPARFVDEAYAALPVGLAWLEPLRRTTLAHQVELARILAKEGDPEAALLVFEQARLDDPVTFGHPRAYVAALLAAGRGDEAEREARAGLVDAPDDAHLLVLLADALVAKGAPGAAVDVYLQAAADRPAARVGAVRAAALAGGAQEAARLVRRLELVGGDDPRVRFELARVLHDDGDAAGCLREIDRGRLTEIPSLSSRAIALQGRCARR